MGRPTQVNKPEVLEKALLLFWKQGYQSTNLPDLLDVTQLTRGTFYRAFGDKRAAYIAALDHYGETRLKRALAMLSDPGLGGVEKRLQALFERTEPHAPGKPDPKIGCFICNAMVEVAPFDPEISKECERLSDVIRTALLATLREVPEYSSEADAERQAEILLRLYLGAHANARLGLPFDDWSAFFRDFLPMAE